jgi:hypothetical protein
MNIVCLSFTSTSLCININFFHLVNVDDCWQITRDASGIIQADPKTFPSGIRALADYVHSRKLKFGIYSGIIC